MDRDAVYSFVDKLDPVSTVIVSGGAKGVDLWAQERAEKRGIRTVIIRPNWKKYGKSAGFRRNKEIVMAADDVVAFWDGKSKGTENTIKHAVERRRPTAIFGIDGKLIRFITPGPAQEPEMAVPRGAKRPHPSGPRAKARHPRRTERHERRKAEARERREGRRIENRLRDKGVYVP